MSSISKAGEKAASTLTRKDFMSDQEVRWCPGCGDYAILATLQRTLPTLTEEKAKTVFISGIGCSSRFPYYMNTYGFHTIHGRAPAFATGLKITNPELDVWVITGDGDGLSIGGNHLLHVLRRNVDLQVLLFNNQIYGLTKGQASPTSLKGQVTPTTPMGSIDTPFGPAQFALGAGARFVARGIDTAAKTLGPLMVEAKAHKGTSFVEILQNCPVFNDGAFVQITDKKSGPDNQLWLEHGKPMIFGADKNKGLRLRPNSMDIEVVTIGEDGVEEGDVLVHDETSRAAAFQLAALQPPHFPKVFGVIYRNPEPAGYEVAARQQLDQAIEKKGKGDLNALLHSGHTWEVE